MSWIIQIQAYLGFNLHFIGKPRGIRAARKLRVHRRTQRWAQKVRFFAAFALDVED